MDIEITTTDKIELLIRVSAKRSLWRTMVESARKCL